MVNYPRRMYILKRLLETIPLIFGIIVITFLIIHMAPGDPTYLLVGEGAVTEEYIQKVREDFGIDKPIYVQLITYIRKVFSGQLGYSFINRQPVLNLIISRIPNTLLLMCTSSMISITIGIFLGITCARRAFSVVDNILSVLAVVWYSTPIFWLGLMLILIFAANLKLFPVQGMYYPGTEGTSKIVDILWHLALPAITLSLAQLALISRITRTSMIEVLGKDFIVTARLKGLSERSVVYKHAFRNALLPVVTITGLQLGRILAGAVLTETVFAWPGLGRLMYESAVNRDYPVLMGMFIVVSAVIIIVNLITDVIYAFLDPRISY